MNIDLTLPSGWHQVAGRNLTGLAKLFLHHREKPDFLIRSFFLFAGWKPLRRPEFILDGKKQFWFSARHSERSRRAKFYLDADVFTSLVKNLEWITEGIDLPAGLPVVRGFKNVNYKLYNVSLETFLEAENYYNAYVEKGKFSFIDKLFSLFYTRKKLLAWPSKAEKYAVFLWFTGVKGFLANKYPFIFSNSSGSTGDASPEETILNLLSSLNLGDVTNNIDIFKTHVHECFHELNLKIEHAPKNK